MATLDLASLASRGLVPGLPAVCLDSASRRNPNVANARLGATVTNLAAPQGFADVTGQPSLKIVGLPGGGVAARLERNSRYAENISDDELQGIRTLAARLVSDAEAFSQGPLSYAELRRRNHPFGRGLKAGKRRGGVGKSIMRGTSNMAVVNRHSGDYAGAWQSDVKRGKSGITVELANSAPYAAFLALGTVRMKAHGPFSTVPARLLPALNREWLKLTRRAWQREQALKAIKSAVRR